MLGGRRRSSFYYDIWNIKYLSKFKWDDLTNEIGMWSSLSFLFCPITNLFVLDVINHLTWGAVDAAEKNRTREQKLALELSAAKRERDFYLSKVDQSRALKSMKERIKKVRMLIFLCFL